MAYNKTNWEDLPSVKTSINAERLNKMEEGIYVAHENIDKIPDWVYSEDKPTFDGYTKSETDALLNKKANAIISSASGETIITTDSAEVTPVGMTLFGKSTQDGTPSLETQIDVVPHGASGSIEQKILTRQLFDVHSCINYTVGRVSFDGEYIVINCDNSNGTSNMYAFYEYAPVSYLKPSTTYKLITEVVEFELSDTGAFYVNGNDANNNKLTQFSNAIKITKVGTSIENVLARDNFNTSNYFIRGSISVPSGTVGKIKVRISILEDTTVTANTFVYEPYSEQVLVHQTPNGLGGIPLGQTIPNAIKNSPIHMSGVYHDGEQYWIGNTKNENGQDVQRVKSISPNKTLVFGSRNDAGRCSVYIPNYFENTKFLDGSIFAYSSIAPFSSWVGGADGTFCINGDSIYYKDSTKTLEEVNAEFAKLGTDVEFVGVLKEPIVTDLTEEELAQYNAVHMNYPNTTIVNSDSAYTEVEYVADTKIYVDNKFKELEANITSAVAQLL